MCFNILTSGYLQDDKIQMQIWVESVSQVSDLIGIFLDNV